ncbi:Uncharacterized protein YuzE [Corynebacterium pollutisoli]|uniref:Uncharacterized protein YuzE n=1 Tax=Corynebacterium pollutisoli TaxID=1610489 RepID=A0A1X7HWN7_9CORY|nr:DUF2283 domain-containing protein [Corynebacterium pollutisoli]SMG06317.1 Uncharacterized protein YuzE [Corynebacterium pollutisoli]
MDLTYDPHANSAYLTLGTPVQPNHRVVGGLTLQGMNGEVIFDLDSYGRIVGMKFDGARELLRPEVWD